MKKSKFLAISKVLSIVLIILAILFLKKNNSINLNIIAYTVILVNYFNIVIEK